MFTYTKVFAVDYKLPDYITLLIRSEAKLIKVELIEDQYVVVYRNDFPIE